MNESRIAITSMVSWNELLETIVKFCKNKARQNPKIFCEYDAEQLELCASMIRTSLKKIKNDITI